MTIIELNKKLRTVPTKWNELSQKQLIAVMDTLFLSQYTVEEGRLKLLKILAGLSWWSFFRCKAADLQEYLYLTDFILAKETHLTEQLLPEYKDMYGPVSEFDNLLMKELVVCDNLFMRWSEDRNNVQLLDEFVAVLYRPVRKGSIWKDYNTKINPEGDVREEFNMNVCQYRAKRKISRWPMAVKLAITTWYDACRWQLVDENDEVFGGENSGDVSKYGLISVMLSVAETGALGDLSKVENQYVKTVMLQLNDSIAKAKEQEKKLKQ